MSVGEANLLRVEPSEAASLAAKAPRKRAAEIRILLVEDNPTDALLVTEMLGDFPSKFHLTQAESLLTACAAIHRTPFDVILSDLSLIDAAGLEAAQALCSAAPASALVVMTGNSDEQTGCDALCYGAQDYLVKGQFTSHSLVRSIIFAITRKEIHRETERIRAEEAQMKDEFLSNVSHEFRSPLAAISSFASILVDGVPGKLNEEQQRYIGIILKNASQLNALVEDLLEVTRAKKNKLIVEPQCICLQDVVRETVESNAELARQRGIHLSAEIEEGVPPAYADPVRMRQVLANLVTNALKFTPQRGSIRLRLSGGKQDARVLLEVIDTGYGIAPDAQKKIFEQLYQEPNHDAAGRKGLGLGLYICRQIVIRQGGKIWVESTPGQGSRFCVTVPAYSLYDLVLSPIQQQTDTPQSLALVIVKVDVESAQRPPIEFCRGVRRTIESCLLPNLDALVTRYKADSVPDRFLILAVANEDGVQVLANRLRNQLKRAGDGSGNDAEITIESRMLDPQQVRGCKSKEELAMWTSHELGRILAKE